jgi:L-fuconolactonase
MPTNATTPVDRGSALFLRAAEITGDQMVAAIDAVGVDGAILVSPFSMYRYDASYALEVYAAHPDRFRLVKPVDPTDPAVVETIATRTPI